MGDKKSLDSSNVGKLINLIKTALKGKQDKVTGTAGKFIAIGEDGELTTVDGVTKGYLDEQIGGIVSALEEINGVTL